MSVNQPKPSKSWLLWAAIATGFALWAAGLLYWLDKYPTAEVRNQLIHLSPQFFWIGFVVLLISVMANASSLQDLLRRFTPQEWVAVALVALLALVLARGVAPRVHRLYYDEDIYQAIALNISQNNHAAMINDGRWDNGHFTARIQEYNKQPNGWPFLINLAFRVAGVNEGAAFTLSHILFALAAVGVLICGAALYGSFSAGLFASLIYVTIPENVRWFSTVAVEPSTACVAIWAVCSLLYFLHRRHTASLFLAAALWALAVQFRPEGLLLLALVGVWIYIDAWEELARPRLYAAILLFLVLISAHLAHLFAVRGENWGSSAEKLSLLYVKLNGFTNLRYYVQPQNFPVVYGALMLLGLLWPGAGRKSAYASLWFTLTWGIFLFFYAGSYTFGADVRFAVLSLAPLSLLAGRGLTVFGKWLEQYNVRRAGALIVLSLGLNLLAYLPTMRAVGAEAWACRIDHDAAREFAKQIPPDGIIMTHNPNMFQLWGKNAAQMSLFTERAPYATNVIQPEFKDKIFLHWNYWCNTQDPLQQSFCRNMVASYSTELVERWPDDRQRLELYRVLTPSSSGSPKTPARQ